MIRVRRNRLFKVVLAALVVIALVNLYMYYHGVMDWSLDAGMNPEEVVNRMVQNGQLTARSRTRSNIHFLYNVGCGGKSLNYNYQLIQALALDRSWEKYQAVGRLTRIVSGCVDDKQVREIMSRTSVTKEDALNRFDVYFTQTNDTLPNGKVYVMFNRPNALINFFKDRGTDDTMIYAVLDPDFIFLKQFPRSIVRQVQVGRPVAGFYGLGSRWIQWGGDICVKFMGKPAHECKHLFSHLTSQESARSYEAGAPYLMYRADWQRFLPEWIALMPPTYEYYSGIESDMYAYMITSVKLGIIHRLYKNMMRTCMVAETFLLDDTDVFIHYCQRFTVFETRGYNFNHLKEFLSEKHWYGDFQYTFTFSKYWMQIRNKNQQWINECTSPILIEPPTYADALLQNLTMKIQKHYQVLHYLIPAINDGLVQYKRKYCDPSEINIEKRVYLHESHRHTNHQLFSVLDLEQFKVET